MFPVADLNIQSFDNVGKNHRGVCLGVLELG